MIKFEYLYFTLQSQTQDTVNESEAYAAQFLMSNAQWMNISHLENYLRSQEYLPRFCDINLQVFPKLYLLVVQVEKKATSGKSFGFFKVNYIRW
jgi:hypothetical protein